MDRKSQGMSVRRTKSRKRWPLKEFLFTFCCMFLTPSAYATLSLNVECPVEFIGKVVQVGPSLLSTHSLSKVRIEFETLEQIKGSPSDTQVIEILAGAIKEVVEGEFYKVSTSNGYLCHIDQVKNQGESR